jgi:outer membrane protease
MKTRIDSRIAFALALLVAGAGTLSALDSGDVRISLSAATGIAMGDAREYVYASDRKLSELVWPLESARLLSFGAGVAFGPKIALEGSFTFGLSGPSGTLSDSDFENVTITGSGARTKYSEHDARLTECSEAELGLARSFDLPLRGPGSEARVSLVARAGFRYKHHSWIGTDGYRQYGEWNGAQYDEWHADMPKVPMSGKVIEYSQTYFAPIAGLEARIPIGSRAAVAASIKGSPVVICEAKDLHVLTGKEYRDHLVGGTLLEPAVLASWEPAEGLSVFARGAWTRVAGLRGTTDEEFVSTGEVKTYGRANGGGARYDAWSVLVGVRKTLRAGKSSQARSSEAP